MDRDDPNKSTSAVSGKMTAPSDVNARPATAESPVDASKRWGLIAGIVLAALVQVLPRPAELSVEAWLLLSVILLMSVWWATEAIPIAATALIPLAVFPFLGIADAQATASPYASPVVMMALGGFTVGLAIERWRLPARIAINLVLAFGTRPEALVLGFMVAAATLSMWISNTATTLIMIPIAIKVVEAVAREGIEIKKFGPAIALAIAYSASVGGMATPLGTPTNLVAIGYLENEFDRAFSFVDWMTFGIPTMMIVIPVVWLLLTRVVFRWGRYVDSSSGRKTLADEKRALGRISTPEFRVATVFTVIAILWIGQNYLWNPLLETLSAAFKLPVTLKVSNMQIAIMGAIVTFLIPAGGEYKNERLMNWESTKRLPWGVIILFGGGLSMAAAISSSGLADWIGEQLAVVAVLPLPIVVLILCFLIVFLTELTSNIATVAAFLPILGAVAVEANVPAEILIIPVALAASCAFMLPVATAPNAIVFASGQVSMSQMIKAGFRINLIVAPIIAFLSSCIGSLMYGAPIFAN